MLRLKAAPSIAFLTLFVTAAAFAQSGGAAAGAAASATGADGGPWVRLALEGRLEGEAALTVDPEDPLHRPLKAQAAGSAAAGLMLALGSHLAVGASLGAHLLLPSDVRSGFRYRGLSGAELRAVLRLRLPLRPAAASGPALEAGLGAAARYERYLLTSLYLFYPLLLAEPGVEIPLSRRQSLAVGLPLQWWLRRDGVSSWAVGLGLAWRFYPGGVP